MNKNLTDTEIKKALDYWEKFDKEIDEMLSGRYKGDKDLLEQKEIVKITFEVFDQINRLQAKLDEAEDTIQFADKELKKANAEIESLQAENKKNENIIRLTDKTIATANAEIERLKQNLEEAHIDIREHLAENERLKEEVELLHSDYTYKFVKEKAKAEAYKEFAELLEQRFALYYGMKIDFTNASKIVNNLLKELVGDSDV